MTSGLQELTVRLDKASSLELEHCLRELTGNHSGLSLPQFCECCRSFLEQLFTQLASDAQLLSLLEREGLWSQDQLETAGKGLWHNWQIHLLLCSDSQIAKWNHQFRQLDKATDILSFPSMPAVSSEPDPQTELRGGDLLLSLRSWLANCQEFGCEPEEELQRLLIHGVLHLVGLDHHEEADLGATQSPMLQYQENLLKQSLQRRAILIK